MTANQTIDGVPRDLLERCARELSIGIGPAPKNRAQELRAMLDAKPETVAGHHPACRAVDDYKPGECSHGCKPAVQLQPDPVLCKFYDVTDWPGLVRELVGHVALLQDSAKRNVKPWEDTFPPTLLPAYIERVNADNAAAQPQGEPVAWATIEAAIWGAFADGSRDYKGCTRERLRELQALYSEQPAPITVVHPFAENVVRKLERFQECADDGQGADIGRHWFDLLTQLGLLNRVQRSPALWEMTQQGEDALELSRQSAKPQ